MFLEILGRPNHCVSLRPAERNCNHIAGNEAFDPDAQIEPVLDDIDHFALGNDIDIHVRVAAQELQHER